MWHSFGIFPFLAIAKFLLTHPVWDVTLFLLYVFVKIRNFYSHIPCGMWPSRRQYRKYVLIFLLTHPVWDVTWNRIIKYCISIISTHTSRVGCDWIILYFFIGFLSFLLTHPVWDVTSFLFCLLFHTQISTHTSRVGCDIKERLSRYVAMISTHTSRVGCDITHSCIVTTYTIWFLLTHPVWDVTAVEIPSLFRLIISTHTSRVGCDGIWTV